MLVICQKRVELMKAAAAAAADQINTLMPANTQGSIPVNMNTIRRLVEFHCHSGDYWRAQRAKPTRS
jgi:hypothetical protein